MENNSTQIETEEVSRRLFLAKSGKVVVGSYIIVGAGLAFFTGCGNGGSSGSNPLISDGASVSGNALSGTVNTVEVGGENLQVVTTQQVSTPVNTGGAFSTTVSDTQAHLVTVTESTNSARGLAMWIPSGGQASANRNLVIDANTTAASLIFCTPGILDTAPDAAAQRYQQITKLPSFTLLADYFRANLPSRTLSDMFETAEFAPRLEDCINQWIQQYPSAANRHIIAHRDTFTGSSSGTGVRFTLRSQAEASPAHIDIENIGWRYIRVYRRDLVNGLQKTLVSVHDDHKSVLKDTIRGADPLSWSNLFGGTGAPTTVTDMPDFGPKSGLTESQYWIVGLGSPAISDIPPNSIDPAPLEVAFASVMTYFVLPAISAIAAFGFTEPQWIALSDTLTSILLTEVKVLDSLRKFVTNLRSHDSMFAKEVVSALKDVVVVAAQVMISNRHLYNVLVSKGVSNAKAVAIQAVLEVALLAGTLFITLGNTAVALTEWNLLPQCRLVPVQLTGQSQIQIS